MKGLTTIINLFLAAPLTQAYFPAQNRNQQIVSTIDSDRSAIEYAFVPKQSRSYTPYYLHNKNFENSRPYPAISGWSNNRNGKSIDQRQIQNLNWSKNKKHQARHLDFHSGSQSGEAKKDMKSRFFKMKRLPEHRRNSY